MRIAEELHIGKPLEPGHELILSILMAREHLGRAMDERIFKPSGITDQQFNVLRILKGGPVEGYAIGELRRRVIARNADVPRLVDRLAKLGLVKRHQNPRDRRCCHVRITPEGDACQARVSTHHALLLREVDLLLPEKDRTRFLGMLEVLRDGLRKMSAPPEEVK